MASLSLQPSGGEASQLRLAARVGRRAARGFSRFRRTTPYCVAGGAVLSRADFVFGGLRRAQSAPQIAVKSIPYAPGPPGVCGQEQIAPMAASSATSEFAAESAGPVSGLVSGLAGRYAGALFDLAAESGALEAVAADLQSVQATIAASSDFRSFLSSPVYDADSQARAIAAIAAKAGLSALTGNFLQLVTRKRRLFALEAMIAAFAARLAAHRGEVGAEAVSATPLNDEQKRRLRAEIEAVVGKAVNLSVRADPELLGGLIVKVGSTMIDSSLKTKLSRLKSVMKEA